MKIHYKWSFSIAMLNYLGLTGAMYGIHDVYSVCQAFIDRSSGSRTKSGARGVAGGETPRRRDHFFQVEHMPCSSMA